MTTPTDFLFEKVFAQAAHISILEEAMAAVESDLRNGQDLAVMLAKIEIAHNSIAKLKQGFAQ